MNMLEKEYVFFKKICQSQSLEKSPENQLLSQQLQAKGLKMVSDKDAIVLVNDIQALCKATILSALTDNTRQLIDDLQVVFQTASTNQAIRSKHPGENYSILLAEYQTGGLGRRKKKWSSPLGENIYLSIRFALANHHATHFIPLITAIAICQALTNIGINNCRIKWPNDVYLDNKKLAGILVESCFDAQKHQHVTVGIGLNVNMTVNTEIDKHWTSLFNSQKITFDRNKVVSALLTATLGNYNQLSVFDFNKFYYEWSKRDYLKGKQIQVLDERGCYNARALNLAEDGALVVEIEDNHEKIQKRIYSAEVSVVPDVSLNSDK